MKKTLFKGLFLSLVLIALVGVNAWGGNETWTWTAASGDFGSSGSATTSPTLNGKSWTLSMVDDAYLGFASNYIQVGSKNNPTSLTLSTTEFSSYTITAVSAVCYSYNGLHTYDISVGGTSMVSGSTSSSANSTITTGTISETGAIVLTFTNNLGRAFYIKSITIDYVTSGCSTLATPTVTATAGGGQVTLSWDAVAHASSYSLVWNGGAAETVTSPVTKTGLTNGTSYTYSITAIGDGTNYCDGTAATGSVVPVSTKTYTLLTDASQLYDGMPLIFVCNAEAKAAGLMNSATGNSYMTAEDVTLSTDLSEATFSDAYEFTLGGTTGAWTFTNSQGTLASTGTSSGNLSVASGNDNTAWTVAITADGAATIKNTVNTTMALKYNASSPRFTAYSSSQTAIQIYAICGTLYNITTNTATNGTISAGRTKASEGAVITLTATPDCGYLFDSWNVYKTGSSSTKVTVTGNQFTMPAYDVTVEGTFVAATLDRIEVTTAPTTTIYDEGTKFSTDGMVVTAYYSNGTSKVITAYTYQPTTALKVSSTEITISYTECDVTKTTTQAITVNELPKYTVTFNAGSGTCTRSSLTESTPNGGVKLPVATPSDACLDDWTFMGWSAAAVSETTTEPTLIGAGNTNYYPTEDITLYAVYKKTEDVGGGVATDVTFDATTKVSSQNGVTLSVTSGTLTNGEDYRVYKKGYLTIESTVGAITSIVFTFTSSSYDGGGWSTTYTPNANSWTSPMADGEQARITNIVVTVLAGASVTTFMTSPSCTPCTDAGVTFALGTEVEKVVGSSNFTNAVSYTNENTGTKTYTSSDPSVATVNATTGEVTIVGIGETTITLKQPRTNGICAVLATYKITVTSPDVDVIEVETDGIVIETNEGDPTVVVQERQTGILGNVANDIFFSKYFEAASNMKLFALYNGTNKEIDLSKLRVRGGGTTWPSSSGSLMYVELGTITKLGTECPDYKLPAGQEIIFWSNNYGTSGETNWTNNETLRNCVAMTINGVSYTIDDLEADAVPFWYCLGDKKTYNTLDADGNNQFTFNGAHSLSLERYNTNTSAWEMIDLIGAGTMDAPVRPGSSYYKKITTKYTINGTSQALNDGDGFYCDHDDVSTTPELSTNRYLLTRKTSVLDGSNAVTSNTTYFATLCTEWDGTPVGSSDASFCHSGKMFSEIGEYDYASHYTTYVDIDATEYNPTKNNDGTVTVKFNDLAKYSCKQVKIQVKNGDGDLVAEKLYKVPLIVTGTKTTTADLFTNMGKEECATCDVAILKDAKLTKSKTGTTNDVHQFHNMEVYAGGELVVPSDATDLQLNSLILRSKGDVVSSAKIDGTVTAGSYSHAKRVDGARYYFFVLPYNCNVADITYYNGKPLGTRGTDWEIKYYDGAGRAAGQNAGHWEVYTGTTLAAGTGYILGVDAELYSTPSYDDNHKLEFLFPLGTTLSETTEKASSVTAYGWGDTSIGDNHKGWNLVGVPYMSKYGVITSTGFKLGIPSYDPSGEGTNYEWLESPEIVNYLNATVPYVTVPNSDGKTYTQVLASSKTLEPFKSYFVQVGLETEPSGQQGTTSGSELTAIVYPQDRRTSAPAMRSVMETSNVDYVPLTLSNGTSEDVTTIIVDEEQSEAYTIGADLEKMYGYSTLPQLYSHMGNVKMAFNALNAVAAAGNIPLGYYAPVAGSYTFSTSASGDDLEGVYLTDNVTGTVTNLLLEDYTFTSEKTTKSTIDDRFTVSVVRTATGVENLRTNDVFTFAHDNVLRIVGVEVGSDVKVYDAIGRLVVSDVATDGTLYYDLPLAGVYMVQLQGKNNKETIKVVNY